LVRSLLSQAHRDSGDRKSAEKYFAQALKVPISSAEAAWQAIVLAA